MGSFLGRISGGWHETGEEKRGRTTARAMALASTTTGTMDRGGSVALGPKSTATPNQKQKVHTWWRTAAMRNFPSRFFE